MERDGSEHVRQEIEVGRLRAELSAEFGSVAGDEIEQDIRAEFDRRATYPIQDFVAVFVERSVRARLRQ